VGLQYFLGCPLDNVGGVEIIQEEGRCVYSTRGFGRKRAAGSYKIREVCHPPGGGGQEQESGGGGPLSKSNKQDDQATNKNVVVFNRGMQELWLDYFKHRVSIYNRPISATITLPESNATKVAENVTFYSGQLNRGVSQVEASKSEEQPLPFGGINAPSPSSIARSHLTIRITNPRFFTRFFSHQDPLQTIYLDIISQPDERRLAEVNNLSLFRDLLHPQQPKATSMPKNKQPTSQFHSLNIIPRLRRLKASLELSSFRTDEVSPPQLYPISHRSTLDRFFQTSCRYRRNCMKAILVDLIAFGEAESLDLYERVLEVGIWSVTIGLTVSLAASMQLDIGGLAALGVSMWSSFSPLCWSWSWSVPADLAGVNAPLLWSAVKAVF